MMSGSHLLKVITEPWLALNRELTVRSLTRKIARSEPVPEYTPMAGHLLYVAASALPYHISGYTTRTHEVVRALLSSGANVHVLTRPGYPWDRKDRHADAQQDQTVVDGVPYHHARQPANNRPVLPFVTQAAEAVAQAAIRHRASVIHAASNHVNALPALLAARRLGIPFQYEMRGLWELSRVSRMPHYDGSQGFKQGLQLEGLVASQADRLFVISEQLGMYARQRWGVHEERMALLPNCIDPERFALSAAADVVPDTVGYAGSLIGYEGLDVLIDAVALMAQGGGHPVRVQIIGDGEARTSLEDQVRRLGLQERIQFTGKLPPEQARALLARSAIVCIPRRPYEVCKIVPPIKLVEALATGKTVVIPDLPVFRDEAASNVAAHFFKAADAVDLARVLTEVLLDRDCSSVKSEAARRDAVSRRSWQDFIKNILPIEQQKGNYGRPDH